MNEQYIAWIDKRLQKINRRIDAHHRNLTADTQALYRLREAMMQRRALEDARDYARLDQVHQERIDRVRTILAKELHRRQISPAFYQQVMATLSGTQER